MNENFAHKHHHNIAVVIRRSCANIFSLDDGSHYVVSIRNNCWENFASDCVYLERFHSSIFKTSICDAFCYTVISPAIA